MDHTACHIIFCDRRAERDGFVRRDDWDGSRRDQHAQASVPRMPQEVGDNIGVILATFQEVFVCHSGMACSNRLRQLEDSRQKGVPVVVFLDIDPKVDFGKRLSRDNASLMSANARGDDGLDEYYGISLLKHLVAEAHGDGIGKLVVPIALARNNGRLSGQYSGDEYVIANLRESLRTTLQVSNSVQILDPSLLMRCLDAGAADAFVAPLTPDSLQRIIVAAYKAHLQHAKERTSQLDLKRIRKRSWVGIEEERPYAYLREAMVSSLMNSICRPETTALGFNISLEAFEISKDSRNRISQAIGTWQFSAHSFSDDELLYGAFMMLSHCLQMPELQKWSVTQVELQKFLVASRAAYNSFVLYHNFRHVVDVLQALFYSLLRLRVLPKYPSSPFQHYSAQPSALARILSPLDALVLLVSAIGHDVGHPGVNNAFLVTLKAPLAQLYNDKSVLEAFHCAAFSQILRRHWKSVYEDAEFRRLLINTILATDMGIHPEYMANLGNLQEKLHHDGGTDSWTAKLTQSNKDLILGLLIKCADISNVARPFDTAAQWARILQQEFARQGEMERDVGMSSTLFGGPPELGNIVKLANSQIGFMNFFGLPLFESVADIMPELHFAVEEITKNKGVWEQRIELEKRRQDKTLNRPQHVEGAQSPRSASPDRTYFTVSPAMLPGEGAWAADNSKETSISEEKPFKDNATITNRRSLLDGTDDFFTPPASPQILNSQAQNTRRNGQSAGHNEQTSPLSENLLQGEEAQVPIASINSGTVRRGPEIAATSDRNTVLSSSRAGSQNFSRPYSQQHSTQTSCAATKSSASGAPTSSSTNYPTSPTETQATSIGDEIEGNNQILASNSFDRPLTDGSDSDMLGLSINSPSRSSQVSLNIVSGSVADKFHPNTRPLTSQASASKIARDRHTRDNKTIGQIKRRSSRWKFDFWRRKRQGERDNQALDDSDLVSGPSFSQS